jgi:hypothetical protein
MVVKFELNEDEQSILDVEALDHQVKRKYSSIKGLNKQMSK